MSVLFFRKKYFEIFLWFAVLIPDNPRFLLSFSNEQFDDVCSLLL